MVAVVLQQLTNCWVFYPDTMIHARHANGQQARTERVLPQGERRPARCAGLLRIMVGKQGAFRSDAVDIGCIIIQHAPVVGADVVLTDVIAKDHDDVGFLGRKRPRGRSDRHKHSCRTCQQRFITA